MLGVIPDAGSDEDIDVLGVRLHVRHCLDGRSARTNHRHPIVRPLLLLVVLGPASCMHDFALELILQTRNIRPLEVIKDTSTVQQQVAVVFELASLPSRSLLAQLDLPLAFLLVPPATDDLRVEGHVLA